MRALTIGSRRIAEDEPAYVIAELGHNHQGKLELARQMIQTAAMCGVDAVKLQKRQIQMLYSQALLDAPYEHEHSFGKTYGEHRQALEFGAHEYQVCRALAHTHGIECFATAFDEASADFLMLLDVPAIKLASSAVTDDDLLCYVAGLGRPIILSTGGADFRDVDHAVDLLTGYPTPFALLHCTAAYPVLDMAELNLRAIPRMLDRYPDTVIGWSGHDPGLAMSYVAFALGARIIEKHVTLNRASKGTDHSFSLEPQGLRTLCDDLKKAHLALGDGEKRLYDSERKPLAKMRRQPTSLGPRVTGSLHAPCH